MSKPAHLQLSSFEAWPQALPTGSSSFQLFLALDGRHFDDDRIRAFARRALSRGMVTASVWGPDCERVHDLIDDVIVDTRADETLGSVILTTWHADGSLEDAWDVFMILEPAADYTGCVRLAVSVGNDAYGQSIARRL